MCRTVVCLVVLVGFAPASREVGWAQTGTALSSPASKVNTTGTVQPRTGSRQVWRANRPVAASPGRIPLREGLPYRPTVSPYLNIFRPEASKIFNYYTLVRPQLAQQQINRQRAAQLQALQQQLDSQPQEPAAPTSRFMNHGKYFGGRP